MEDTRVRELADHNRIETGIPHKHRSHLQCFSIVTGNRNRELWIGAVRFAREDRIGECVECAYQPRAGQVLLRGYADAVALDFVGKRAVAGWNRVAGLEQDLPLSTLA